MEKWEKLLDELIDYWETLAYRLKDTSNSCIGILNTQLSEQEWKVIVFLGKEGDARMKDIARHMNLVGSTLTSIADKLVEKGCVERKRCKSDRRIVRLSLTKEGSSVFQALREMRISWGKELLSLLNNKEKEIYVNIMKKMAKRSENFGFRDDKVTIGEVK